jgi:hypothetical protein
MIVVWMLISFYSLPAQSYDPLIENLLNQTNPQGFSPYAIVITQDGKYAINCETRETCTYSKPEEGIWHCEEYR